MQRALWICLWLLGAGGAAAAEVTGEVTLASDFVYAGVSQSDRRPALQLGLSWEGAGGLYTGLWASTMDNEGDGLWVETSVGIAGELPAGVGWDLGTVLYHQPGVADAGYHDLFAGLTFHRLSAYAYHDPEGEDTYLELSLGVDLPRGFELGLHVEPVLAHSYEAYTAYGVSLGHSWRGLDVELRTSATTLDDGACEADYGRPALCGGGTVLAVGRGF